MEETRVSVAQQAPQQTHPGPALLPVLLLWPWLAPTTPHTLRDVVGYGWTG